MKNILILLISLISFVGYGQTMLNPQGSNTVAVINDANTKPTSVAGTDTYTATLTGSGYPSSGVDFYTYLVDRVITLKFANAATSGPYTINLNSKGAKTLKKKDASGTIVDIVSTDIPAANTILPFRYDGTYFVLEGGSAFGLTNGNGTTANTSAVDLGGTISSDVIIEDSDGTHSLLVGSSTPLSAIEMYGTGFVMGDIVTRTKTLDIGTNVFLNNTLAGGASFRINLSSNALALQTGTSGSLASRLSFNSSGNPTWTLGSDATGDMWYRNSSGFMTRIAAGAQNTILTMGASSVPSWSQTVLSGTYTPTLTNVANLDASTAFLCTYMRVGNTVTVSGRVDIDPTTTLTSTQLGISLPVASALTTSNQAGGTAQATAIAQGAAILSDAANDRAQLQYVTIDTTNQSMYFTFTYQIL